MIHVARILIIFVFYPFMKLVGVNLSWKDNVMLVWSGLRGSMSLILVLIVTLDKNIDPAVQDQFLFHVSMIVSLTLIINGTSSKYLVRILGLNRGKYDSIFRLSH